MFNALVFGAFVGSLTDYWLGRFTVKDPVRLVIAVVVGVVVAFLVADARVAYF